MLEPGTQILMQLAPAARDQGLVAGHVEASPRPALVVAFDDEAFSPRAGAGGVVFFHARGDFLRQPVRIERVEGAPPCTTVELTLRGEAVQAEKRRMRRVSTVASELLATVEGEANCPLLDISRVGLAVLSNRRYGIGQVVEATVHRGEAEHRGAACVLSVRELWKGRFRYGMLCLRGEGYPEDLASCLEALCGETRPLPAP